MATRRPKVPSAQFSAGAKKAAAEPGTTPDPAHGDHGTSHGAHQPATGRTGSPRPSRQAVTNPGNGRSPAAAGPARTTGSHAANHAAGHASQHHDPANTPVPARSFNGRLLVLGLAMAAVTVALAPNIHTYMDQRAEISALKQDIVAQTAQQGVAKSELARWDDPAYVKQQARDRVSMLMPGETGYWVYGEAAASQPDGTPAAAPAAAGQSAIKATTVTTEPWVDSLWQAVEKSAAVKPAAPAAKAPPKPAAK
ncbi:septum formation initiator family protein [Arthrobacter sp. SDTb3-6]|uniref:FtsB family cell division protein n=1 Tax=Arthrobacter sp. SDTb3-6 TaxID=2713571 RepID=UPI00159E2241|nr:septum formation initiator family protein [Arthrobacter sp. SDTb3-6]NVM99954.1 septum formation initiator family protein [Arthrobacter sp. SDTb3-6]